MDKINWEEISLKIINKARSGKGSAILALRNARKREWLEADRLIAQAEHEIHAASVVHMDIMSYEAAKNQTNFPLLFSHAEDQLTATQYMIELTKEIVMTLKTFFKEPTFEFDASLKNKS